MQKQFYINLSTHHLVKNIKKIGAVTNSQFFY